MPCSMWERVVGGCAAPREYAGQCKRVFDASNMSDADKFQFGLSCGARYCVFFYFHARGARHFAGCRWPCVASPAHDYEDLCPQRWTALVQPSASWNRMECI